MKSNHGESADPIRILLVDDLKDNLLALDGLLRRDDVEIVKAQSGTDALELLALDEFALALVDVQMPGMSGFELAELMRGTKKTKNVPIIFVTANSMGQSCSFKGYESGAVDFLLKPLDTFAVRSKVNVFIELFRQKREQERLLKNLTESQAVVRKLSSVVEQTDDLVLITQIDGRIEYVNPAFLKLTGYSSAEVIGQTPRILKSGKMSAEFYHDLWETILSGESYQNVFINRKKDGTFFHSEKTITPLKDERGKILRFVSTEKDITDRKTAEESHARALRRFQDIFNFSKDGMAYKGLDGRLLDVNAAFCSITGYSKEELVGKKQYRDLTPEEYHSAEDQILKDVLSGGEPVEHEKEYLHKDGHRVPVQLTIFAVIERGVGNTVSAVATIVKDISERKQAELELNKKKLELERSNEELERFASLASHDLQEPLRTIASHLQLVERFSQQKLDGRTLESLHFAVDGAIRMKVLINDILVYSKVGSARRKPVDVDSGEVVQEVLGRISDSLKESRAEVIIGELPHVFGDRGQLSQLFQNLFSNANKYRSDRPLRIEVGGACDETSYKFWVKDNGLGIPTADQNRIFTMFQRLHTAVEYPGTGIGLATCKKIVENHGGKIWVESVVGEGSTFCFTLEREEIRAV